MTTRKSYFILHPRGFANEYDVGIATTPEGLAFYSVGEFEPITRKQAIRELTRKGDNATQNFGIATINGKQVYATMAEVAHEIKTGGDLPIVAWSAY